LYDLEADPGELTNAYQPSDTTATKLQGVLSQLKAREPDSANAQLPDPKDKIEEQNLLHAAMMAAEDDRPQDARAALEKTLQLDPKSPTALRQLGELELNAGEYNKAAEHLKLAREVRPEDATAAFDEGQAREKIGDLAGARDALEASLKLTPGQLPARLLLGKVYLGLKDARAAEDQFEAALLVEPNNVEAQLGVAKANLADGSFAEAAQQLEVLSKAQAGNPEIFELLSQAYAGLGRNVEAQQAENAAKSLRDKKPTR
jgi:predicted Zn-dependent protease